MRTIRELMLTIRALMLTIRALVGTIRALVLTIQYAARRTNNRRTNFGSKIGLARANADAACVARHGVPQVVLCNAMQCTPAVAAAFGF